MIPAGAVLAARYEVLELIGQGGHGAVYRGKQLPLGREVAIRAPRRHRLRARAVHGAGTASAEAATRAR